MEEAEKGAYGLGTGIFLKECSATHSRRSAGDISAIATFIGDIFA